MGFSAAVTVFRQSPLLFVLQIAVFQLSPFYGLDSMYALMSFEATSQRACRLSLPSSYLGYLSLVVGSRYSRYDS